MRQKQEPDAQAPSLLRGLITLATVMTLIPCRVQRRSGGMRVGPGGVMGTCGRGNWCGNPDPTTEGPVGQAKGLGLDPARQCSPAFSPSWHWWTMMLL